MKRREDGGKGTVVTAGGLQEARDKERGVAGKNDPCRRVVIVAGE